MREWSIADTKEWLMKIQSRVEELKFFMEKTKCWCDEQDIYDSKLIFICCFITCIWVSQTRGESISSLELLDILEVDYPGEPEEKLFFLDSDFAELDHKELLEKAVETFRA